MVSLRLTTAWPAFARKHKYKVVAPTASLDHQETLEKLPRKKYLLFVSANPSKETALNDTSADNQDSPLIESGQTPELSLTISNSTEA